MLVFGDFMSNKIKICQVPNTEKFLRDKTYENDSAKEFNLKLYQHETEGVHILIMSVLMVPLFLSRTILFTGILSTVKLVNGSYGIRNQQLFEP